MADKIKGHVYIRHTIDMDRIRSRDITGSAPDFYSGCLFTLYKYQQYDYLFTEILFIIND